MNDPEVDHRETKLREAFDQFISININIAPPGQQWLLRQLLRRLCADVIRIALEDPVS